MSHVAPTPSLLIGLDRDVAIIVVGGDRPGRDVEPEFAIHAVIILPSRTGGVEQIESQGFDRIGERRRVGPGLDSVCERAGQEGVSDRQIDRCIVSKSREGSETVRGTIE